ncbi:hypothetical protein N9Y42_05155 [Mariniblastus sp.]|nr:hypothetical protein [Mariniblastus sp.]
MKQIPTTTLAILLAGLFIVSQTGCRNRCSQQCGGGLFANNTTVAPAPTYSLNIPSVARNQPYYAPNGGPISTTARAPTPATGSSISNSNSNLQWRQQGGTPTNSGSTFGSQPTQSGSGTRLVETNNGVNLNSGSSVLVGGFQNSVATNQALPATGTSFTDSRNFATTQTDERLDATRVPVTDATQVRATAQNFISSGQQIAYNQRPTQTFAAQPAIQQVQPVYSTNGRVAAVQPYYTNNPNLVQRQPIFSGQTFVQPNPSTTYSASTNNDIGWRSREIGSR